MTLNTFHLAGNANAQVTQGIPRLKELLNCTKNIKTPFISAKVSRPDLTEDMFKPVFVETHLKSIELLFHSNEFKDKAWVQRFQYFFLGKKKIPYHKKNWLRLVFDIDDVMPIRKTLKEAFPDSFILATHKDDPESEILMLLDKSDDLWTRSFYETSVETIRKLLVKGIDGINSLSIDNGIITLTGTKISTNSYAMLSSIMDITSIYTNDIHNIFEMYGIEAARNLLYKEIKNVLCYDGAYVNPRHIGIIADSMTHLGFLRPMSRHGLFKDKRSALSNAAFEMATTTINNAAVETNVDYLKGISEQIITGNPCRLGTGAVDLYLDEKKLIVSNVVENDLLPELYDFTTNESYNTSALNASPSIETFSPCFSPENGAQFSPDISSAPAYAPQSPMYSPSTPLYEPSSPPYCPSSPTYNPAESPAYCPATPETKHERIEESNDFETLPPLKKQKTNTNWMTDEILDDIFS